jgi:hypothetical protein
VTVVTQELKKVRKICRREVGASIEPRKEVRPCDTVSQRLGTDWAGAYRGTLFSHPALLKPALDPQLLPISTLTLTVRSFLHIHPMALPTRLSCSLTSPAMCLMVQPIGILLTLLASLAYCGYNGRPPCFCKEPNAFFKPQAARITLKRAGGQVVVRIKRTRCY